MFSYFISQDRKNVSLSCYNTSPVLWFYGLALNALGGLPRPSAPAPAAASVATVIPAVVALVRAHFRQSHQIHQTGGSHRY
jgi:hypothetical protein